MIFGHCTSTFDHHAAEGMIRDKKLKQKKQALVKETFLVKHKLCIRRTVLARRAYNISFLVTGLYITIYNWNFLFVNCSVTVRPIDANSSNDVLSIDRIIKSLSTD